MKLNIYVGTLNRYYRRDWNGGNGQRTMKNRETIQRAVAEWMDLLLLRSMPQNIPWDENDSILYFADNCGIEAYNALGLFQVGHLCKMIDYPGIYNFNNLELKKKLLFPSVITQDRPLLSHPVFKEIVAKEIPTSLATHCSMWLPLESEMLIVSPLPMQKEYGVISTIPYLEKELEMINKLKWNANEAEILTWRDSEYYVPLAKKKNIFQLFLGGSVLERYSTESLAKCAYSIFYRAVQFAKQYNVPIVLDCWDGDICTIKPQKK